MPGISKLRLLLVLLIGLLPLSSFGFGGALVFKAGGYVKVGRLAALSAKDLRYASKSENINGLLELAEQENRIDTIQMLQLTRPYATVADGDSMLLACLQNAKCQPDKFLMVSNTSRLHAEVVKRNPGLGLTQANHAVGALTENMMVRYFEHSGWTRIDGQIGRTGFDGLFVKYEDGVIKDVLIAESKCNTSTLQSTNFGVQMSEEWIRRKMVELKARFPNEDIYMKIDPFIEAGAYRTVLWNIRIEEDALKIDISKVKSKGGAVEIAGAKGSDIESLSHPFTNSIKLKAPRNKFEEQVLGWYNDELAAIGKVSSRQIRGYTEIPSSHK